MCRLGPGLSRPCPPPRPSAESARGQVRPGGPGNLSQLLCPVSGKPPAGVLPAELACPCTCPLGFQEGPGRPSPQRCTAGSPAQTHTTAGCAAHFLPQRQGPSQSEPGEKRAESASGATRGVRSGPSGLCSRGRWGGSAQRTSELGKWSHCPEDHTRARRNASARSRGFTACGCSHTPGHPEVWDVPADGGVSVSGPGLSGCGHTLGCHTHWVAECQCLQWAFALRGRLLSVGAGRRAGACSGLCAGQCGRTQ